MKAVFVDNFLTVVAFKITLTNQIVFLAVTTNFSLNFVNHNNQTGCGGLPQIMLLYNLGLLITLYLLPGSSWRRERRAEPSNVPATLENTILNQSNENTNTFPIQVQLVISRQTW